MRSRLLIAAILASFVASFGCTDPPQDPQELLSDAYESLGRGNLASARANAARGSVIARRDKIWVRPFVVLEAEILTTGGHDAEALALLEEEQPYQDRLAVRALMTRGLARCRTSSERAADDLARRDLDRAAAIAAKLTANRLVGEVALRQGTCAWRASDRSRAEKRFREALQVARAGKHPLLEANASGSLGLLRLTAGRYDDATDWLLKTLVLGQDLQADSLKLKTLGNLGWCYLRLGDWSKARRFLEQAAELASARGYTRDLSYTLTNLGRVHGRLGDHDRAAEYYAKGLALARTRADRKSEAQLLGNLAAAAKDRERYDEASKFVRSALKIADEIDDAMGEQHSLLTLAQVRSAQGHFAKAEVLYEGVTNSVHTPEELLLEARISLADMYVRNNQRQHADVEFRRAEALIDASHARLRTAEYKLSFFASLRRFRDAYVAFLLDDARRQEALLVADESRARMLREKLAADTSAAVDASAAARGSPAARASFASPSARTSSTLRASAKRFRRLASRLDAVLLSYWTAPERSFLWVITPDAIHLKTLPDEKTLRARVDAYQSLILRSQDPLSESSARGEALYRMLVQPAAELIQRGSRVVVVPDGPLHHLNFETLVVPSPRPHYWIEDVVLVSSPSLISIEPERAPANASDASLLLIGDPVASGDTFPKLAQAEREVERIAALYPSEQREVYARADATPFVYAASRPERFAVIHFAAHAQPNEESPLDSSVVLSPKDDSYKLYARDIVDVPLTADLVTLSACRSAGSRTYAGEGLVGLAWAFLSAGAGNVIGALWNVEDGSTAQMMEELHRGLRAGHDPVTALRTAKLTLLRSKTAYRKPFYWAPFVVYTRRPAFREPLPAPAATTAPVDSVGIAAR